MNLKKRLPHSPFAIAAYCLIIVAIGIMYWGGPSSVAGAVAELRIGEGSRSELALRQGHRITIVSGHSFSCDWKDASNNINRCRTNLKGRSLEIEFKVEPFKVPQCNIRYSEQSFQCRGFNDFRHKRGQADLWIENSLGLTDFDRIWLFLTNPLANLFGNITEIDWNYIIPILSWVVAILITAALGLHKVQTPRVGSRFAGFILIVRRSILITPIVGWFTVLVLILTGHVD